MCEVTQAALMAAAPDGKQEDAINATSLTHLARPCPTSSQHLFDQSEFPTMNMKSMIR